MLAHILSSLLIAVVFSGVGAMGIVGTSEPGTEQRKGAFNTWLVLFITAFILVLVLGGSNSSNDDTSLHHHRSQSQ